MSGIFNYSSPLLLIFLGLFFCYVFSKILRRFNFPEVVSQLLTGLLIFGIPFVRNLIAPYEDTLSLFSDMGLIFLLLLVGMKLDYVKLRKVSKDAILIAFSSAVVPFLLGFGVTRLFGFGNLEAVIVGASIAVTSEGTKAKVLLDLNVIRSKLATIMLSAGIADDIFEIFFVSFVSVYAFHSGVSEIFIFPLKLIVFVALVILTFRLFEYVEKLIVKKGSAEMFTVAFILVVLIAYLSYLLGLGVAIGALVAGVILQLSIKERRKESLLAKNFEMIAMAIFVPFFFIYVGYNFKLSQFVVNPWYFIAILAVAFIGKIGGTLLAKPFVKLRWRQLYVIGWGMNSRGAIELVIAMIALANNLITAQVFSVIVGVALLTTLTFPFVMQYELKKNPKIMN